MAQQAIWPGSGSAVSGSTPFGFYDVDSDFQSEAPKFATWCAKRLGYPIMDVELQDTQFYACLEESITEYSSQVNQFNIRDNLLHLQGQSTGSSFTHKKVTPTLGRNVFLSQQYGTEAGVGGFVEYKSGSVNVTSGSQVYDLNKIIAEASESNKAIEIKKVFYESSPAISRYFDPYATTGYGTINLVQGFGFGKYSPAVSFVMMPVFEDLLRIQAIEFNDQVRKSAYSFTLQNNKLRVFPDPVDSFKLWVQYIVVSDRDNPLITEFSGSVDTVSDFSNAPFDNMQYQYINHPGRQWIRKYGFALTKELLGIVRSKYGSIPIPNAETTLDGETLRSEATEEKTILVEQLREMLDQTSRKALLEADKDEADFLQEKLNKVPYPIYIG
jgi:hypothetical protein|tara:strand:- start:1722 stop:2876 length:1155 start_codon:yes stop_codon:yes gene_type:complete